MKKRDVELIAEAIDSIAKEGPVVYRLSDPVMFGTSEYGKWDDVLDERLECCVAHQHVLGVMDREWMNVGEIVTFIRNVYGCNGTSGIEVGKIVMAMALPQLEAFEFVESRRGLPLRQAAEIWGYPSAFAWATVWNMWLNGIASQDGLKLGLVEIATNWRELLDAYVQNEEWEGNQVPRA